MNGESKDSDQTIYSQVSYGSYLSISKKKLDIGEQKWYQYVNMDKTKNRYMIITANKSECKNAFPNTFTYSTSMTERCVTLNKTDASHSGVVILVIVALPNIINNSRYDGSWVNGLYNDVRSCKPNVLESYDHHGSKGARFSFGNKPFYGIVNNNSVGIYANLKRKNSGKQILIDKKSNDIEAMCSTAIKNGIIALSAILPEINILISPMLYAANNIQDTKSYEGLTKVKTSNLGCWNAFMFVNGRTDELHTEKDCAYTCITVLKQKRNVKTALKNKPLFIFKLSTKQHLVITLMNNISFA